MAHGVETDRVQPKSMFDCGSNLFEWEGLKQPQHLDVLSAVTPGQSSFEQAEQLYEALRQLPAGQRRSLVQHPALLFEKSQIVQRIIDRGLALVTTLVFCDDFALTFRRFKSIDWFSCAVRSFIGYFLWFKH